MICDLPFLSYQCGEDIAVQAAGRLIKESYASAVKLEGGEPETLLVVNRLVRMGIPVMGHLGLTPQSVNQIGYKQQAQDIASQELLIEKAKSLEASGCFSLIIEHVPDKLSNKVSELLSIPVIGIGAGENCDGQVRVTADLLGLSRKQPPFSPSLIDGRRIFIEVLQRWVYDHQSDHRTKE